MPKLKKILEFFSDSWLLLIIMLFFVDS